MDSCEGLSYLKVKIDGFHPIPKGRLVKGPKIDQHVWTTVPSTFQGSCNDHGITLPETNMTPENGRLEDEYPFGMAQISGANC